MYWIYMSSPKLKSYLPKWQYWKLIRFRRSWEWSHNGISSLTRRGRDQNFFSLLVEGKARRWLAVGQENDPRTDSIRTFILDFSASSTVRNRVCNLSCSVYGIFIIAVSWLKQLQFSFSEWFSHFNLSSRELLRWFVKSQMSSFTVFCLKCCSNLPFLLG